MIPFPLLFFFASGIALGFVRFMLIAFYATFR